MDKMIKIYVLSLLFLLLAVQGGSFAELSEIHGFAETAYGLKLSNDNTKNSNYNLLEQRLQLKVTYYFNGDNYLAEKSTIIDLKCDASLDEYFDSKTDIQVREINISATPFDVMDIKLGRQILTWGTGDYLFINDMFPKDYISFFTGRHDEYLKKPSDAVKISYYPRLFNADIVVIPRFTPNTHADGKRLSFFDGFQGGIAGINSNRQLVLPADKMENNEYALRIYRNLSGKEAAFYYFYGFDKSPRSYKDKAAGQLYYERLNVYGSSLRGQVLGGIGNAEAGYVYSVEDPDGNNRLIENSMLKAMIGYSMDLGNDLKVGLQYYYERKLDYDNYKNSLLPPDYFWDEHRHLLANRFTKLLMDQRLRLSIFTFYSPSDKDGYIRPDMNYDVNDRWNVALGANTPWGEDETTEFGQMRKNKNIFVRIRYNF